MYVRILENKLFNFMTCCQEIMKILPPNLRKYFRTFTDLLTVTCFEESTPVETCKRIFKIEFTSEDCFFLLSVFLHYLVFTKYISKNYAKYLFNINIDFRTCIKLLKKMKEVSKSFDH